MMLLLNIVFDLASIVSARIVHCIHRAVYVCNEYISFKNVVRCNSQNSA